MFSTVLVGRRSGERGGKVRHEEKGGFSRYHGIWWTRELARRLFLSIKYKLPSRRGRGHGGIRWLSFPTCTGAYSKALGEGGITE